jgi:acyl-CoA synthetase (AMP-forming)/AMP-acid ligase II
VRLALYGGAGLPQELYDRFQRLAIDTTGERIFFTTGYGATETSSGCMSIYFPDRDRGHRPADARRHAQTRAATANATKCGCVVR